MIKSETNPVPLLQGLFLRLEIGKGPLKQEIYNRDNDKRFQKHIPYHNPPDGYCFLPLAKRGDGKRSQKERKPFKTIRKREGQF